MPITRREAKEIVDWVIQEIRRRSFPYSTDGKLDLSKSPVGQLFGTETSGGPIGNGAIWDRHVHDDADIRGTKVRVATVSERGTVELAEDGEAVSGIALQSADTRLHDTAPADSTQHDARYGSTASGLGASLIGVQDAAGVFTGEDVEAVLYELFTALGAATFIALDDTPSSYANRYPQVPTINEAEAGLEWRPVDYYDGGVISETYSGAVEVDRTAADGGSATMGGILDGGDADGYHEVYGDPKTRIGSKANIEAGNYFEVQADGTPILVGDAVVWDDLRTPVTALKLSSTKPPIWTAYKGSFVAAFQDQAVNYQSVYWVWQMPHDYKLGTPTRAHIHFVPEDNTAGNVVWDFTYSVAAKGDAFPAETTIRVTHAMPEVTDKHTRFGLATISGTDFPTDPTDVSTMVLCSLSRRSDAAEDTYGSKDVYLIEADMHYQKDSQGSRLELSK